VKYAGVVASARHPQRRARITAEVEGAGESPDEIDGVVGGQVLQAGAGQYPARQSAVCAALPLAFPAITLMRSASLGFAEEPE
jgi:acetyl-CoA C-acetyltransferase